MEALLNSLLEMGFDRSRAEQAIKATQCAGIAEAMDWLIAHEEELNKPAELNESKATSNDDALDDAIEIIEEKTQKAAEDEPIAQSYKCEECGRVLKNEQEVQYHAAKTQHEKYSESTDAVKPLSEEERKKKLEELQDRLRLKREQREQEEKKQAISMEKQRRRDGKDMLSTKQRIEEQEMKKLAEDRKKQKIEDARTKQRILDEIKQDREAKKKEAGGHHSEEDTTPKSKYSTVSNATAAAAPSQRYDDCRIQVRLFNGEQMTHTFKAKEQLNAVRLYVDLYRTDGDVPYTFMTTFPKRVFNDEDMDATLEHLGLSPSAVLIMCRKQQQ